MRKIILLIQILVSINSFGQDCPEFLDSKSMLINNQLNFQLDKDELIEKLGKPLDSKRILDDAELFSDGEYFEIYEYDNISYYVHNDKAVLRKISLTENDIIEFDNISFTIAKNIEELKELFPSAYKNKYDITNIDDNLKYTLIRISSCPCCDVKFVFYFFNEKLKIMEYYIPA